MPNFMILLLSEIIPFKKNLFIVHYSHCKPSQQQLCILFIILFLVQ
jgi:hypothetical protein